MTLLPKEREFELPSFMDGKLLVDTLAGSSLQLGPYANFADAAIYRTF